MSSANQPKIRHDGWTAERRQRFLEGLAAGLDVRRACAGVGLSRQAAYTLRRRDPAFAHAWDAAQRAAREASERAWLAAMPEWLRETIPCAPGRRADREFLRAEACAI